MQRVPAWKRLGLKLKGADDAGTSSPASASASAFASASASAPPTRPPPSYQYQQNPSFTSGANSSAITPYKRKDYPAPSSTDAKRHKSVSFADGSKAESADTPKKKKNKNKKKKKAPAAPAAPAPPPSLKRELEYLQQWKTARDTWKFNKNHQNLLIKYVFVGGAESVPSSHIDIFYDYISDLQGGVRARLLAEARTIAMTDTAGEGGDEYKKVVQDLKKEQKEQKEQMEEKNTNGKRTRRLSEVEYVLRFADLSVQKRLLRRIRAENVASQLDDGSAYVPAVSAATNGAASVAAPFAPVASAASAAASAVSSSSETAEPAEKRLKLNDSTKKSVRNRKKRTFADSDSDSSDSSDSDSDSGSDSDSDSDSDSETASKKTSKSSSSSSSSSEPGSARAAVSSSSPSSSSSESSDESDSDDSDSD